tara:strand:+ start:470 stop:784 length:315 start_codon:yes stop_codon:yes gene_type:complete
MHGAPPLVRHLIGAPTIKPSGAETVRDPDTGKGSEVFKDLLTKILKLRSPEVGFTWEVARSLERTTEGEEATTDPYDRVFWFVGQAVFLAFLCTGTTLKQMPPR